MGEDDHGILPEGRFGDRALTWQTLDEYSADAARIFIFSAMNYRLGPDNLVTECVLRNATYSVDFAVQDGLPSTVVSQLNINEELPAMGYLYDDDSAKSLEFQEVSNGGAHFSYQAVMDVFGKLLVGYAQADYGGTDGGTGATAYTSSFQRTSVNWFNKTQMRVDLEVLFPNITLSMFSNTKLL